MFIQKYELTYSWLYTLQNIFIPGNIASLLTQKHVCVIIIFVTVFNWSFNNGSLLMKRKIPNCFIKQHKNPWYQSHESIVRNI